MISKNPPLREKLTASRAPADPSKEWWSVEGDEIAQHMVPLVKTLKESQQWRIVQFLQNGYLYQNSDAFERGLGYLNRDTWSGYNQSQVTYNVVKSAIDTLTSRISSSRPRPRVLTENGDYFKQTRAKKLTQYIDGVLYGAKTYEEGSKAFKDGCVFGTGIIKVIPDYTTGEIHTERVLPTELIIDDMEALHGLPLTMYQERRYNRETLSQLFPKHAERIRDAAASSSQSPDMVTVWEGWRINGKHVVCIEGTTLYENEWKYDCFPFAFFRYTSAIASFWGTGIAEEVKGKQIEINKLLRDIQRAQHLIARPRILMSNSSKIVSSH